MVYTNYLPATASSTAMVWYEHSSGTTATFVAGDSCTLVELQADNNGAGNISLNGTNEIISLAANTGVYEVTVFGDTEAPAAGDSTTLEILVNGVAFAYTNVAETNNQTGTWCDLIDTTGAAQTIEINRSSVTGTGRLNVKAKVVALG